MNIYQYTSILVSMPRASKQRLETQVWEQIHKTLVEVISSHKVSDLKKFLFEFLTNEEKVMLAKRLTLYIMLLSGYSDTEIKEVLKMSYETVRTARSLMTTKSKQFKDSLTEWAKEPTQEKAPNRLLRMIEPALSAKGDMKARAKLTSGNY